MDATSQTIPANAKRIRPLDDQRGGSLSRCRGPILSRTESCEAEQSGHRSRSKRQAIHMVCGHQRACLWKGESATLYPWQTQLLLCKTTFMRPWVVRITFPSSALQYVANIILSVLTVMGTFGLLTWVVLGS